MIFFCCCFKILAIRVIVNWKIARYIVEDYKKGKNSYFILISYVGVGTADGIYHVKVGFLVLLIEETLCRIPY